jgi:UDP-N-acetylmuramoyl-tripeptide--D-alanyl-D-alanine ligase
VEVSHQPLPAGRQVHSGRRSIAVLGEMRELGEEHDAGHRAVGLAVAELGVDVLIVVGPEAEGIAVAAEAAQRPPAVVRTAARDDAVTWVRHNAVAGDVVLIKASRGVALEHVADALLADQESGEGTAPC